MKKSAEIYSEALKKYMINDEQLEMLQKNGLTMLSDLHDICVNNGIKYSIFFGTLLGAVRHQGFIPWDDDIDIIIFRDDFDKLKKIIQNYYSDKYYILDDKLDKSYNLPFAKLIQKNSILVEASMESKAERGAFIDIFLVDKAPKRFFKLRQQLYKLFNRCGSLECDFKYPSKTLMNAAKTNKKLKNYYFLRRFAGFFASILSIRAWNSLARLMTKGKKHDNYYVVSGDVFRLLRKTYMDEIGLYDFCGKQFCGIKDYDTFLSSVYGNYMEIPPENKRERHIIVKLHLAKNQ